MVAERELVRDWDVDLDEVFGILTSRLVDFDRYLAAIESYLVSDGE